MKLSPTKDIIDDIREGKMVILMDDEDRENEGDIMMASQWVRPEDINFMARYGRGLICMTMTAERCKQLALPLMVDETNDNHSTNFTVSIEAAKGVTTGISAADRATTVRAAVAKEAVPADIVQPGHIFPIMAQPGGVLSRAGHTEAGCDLARLAGLEASMVIVEILKEDGEMARRPDLEVFAEEHNIKLGTIADLIEYRIRTERTVECSASCDFPSEWGHFTLYAYRDTLQDETHFALVKGDITPEQPTLVRVHMHNDLSDALGADRPGLPLSIRPALAMIEKEGKGILLLIRKPQNSSDLIRQIQMFAAEDRGEPRIQTEQPDDLRTYGVGAQILADLGVKHMRVIGTPKRMHALSGFGLDVVEYINLKE
ncbi:MAG: bifunctional 3,4-dihydroxy-2-butanone-4-phosphate synthase/GTP cyclohydrolase II [Gammaproteobacteria bacterium]|nr:bifunctional 3,4-dihydroxy-2-butanone-4-phosphate synthase/GTP cyclohydrolase II [Gammaproteobacteria bacterium]MDH5728957.1 bifunctional 3,4-dihydroxy-2-butanone-4-phosphate synthase/GTP cyclohydrolase II [Gammaproteobacteria bacterium]